MKLNKLFKERRSLVWLVVWKWRPTETSRRRTLLCWRRKTCRRSASRSASMRCTLSCAPLEATSRRRQVQAPSRPCVLLLDRAWRSAASRTSHRPHLTPVDERVVVVVDDCRKIVLFFFDFIGYRFYLEFSICLLLLLFFHPTLRIFWLTTLKILNKTYSIILG